MPEPVIDPLRPGSGLSAAGAVNPSRSAPRSDDAPKGTSWAARKPLAASPVVTMLLVEDSRHTAEVMRLLSRRVGVRLRRAADLSCARQHLRVYRPDIVIIDLGLPDGSGLDLIAELALHQPRLKRVVAISAEPGARAEALAAGAHAFVAKPLSLPGDLQALLGCRLMAQVPGWAEPAACLPDGTVATSWGTDLHPRMSAITSASADPLALRDDLVRARALLDSPDPQELAYATSFLDGLGRCCGDRPLQLAAHEARLTGRVATLRATLEQRVQAQARI